MSRLGGIISRVRRALGREAKWAPPIGNDLEHDDWRVGDLAKCVATNGWHRLIDGQPVKGPCYGDILRVAGVGMINGWHALTFERTPECWVAECFLKIRPSQREACTPAFRQLIRKHSREGVDA